MKHSIAVITTVVSIACVLFWLALMPLYVYGTQQDRVITVRDKERVVTRESSYYLIFAEEGEFKNEDSILRWKFDSSRVYNRLEAGKAYNCDTYGWRIPFLSVYPNIVECEEESV